MDLSLVPYVDNADIKNLVGEASLTRARAYASNGRVRGVSWVEDKLMLQGRVTGSRAGDYRAGVTFDEEPTRMRLVRGVCTCPLRSNCKHVAALILTTNRLLEQDVPPVPAKSPVPRAAGQAAAGKPAPVKVPQQSEPPRPAPWEKSLASVLRASPPHQQLDTFGGQRTTRPFGACAPMALQFELIETQAPTFANAAAHASGRPPASKPLVQLGVRPVSLSPAGKWVASVVSWDRLQHSYYTISLNQSHVEWFNVLHALGKPAQSPYTTGKHIYLDKVNSPLLWQLLDQASQAGIAFVTDRLSTTVSLHGEASAALDVLSVDGGGLRLSPLVEVDGQLMDPESVGTLGTPVHGLFYWDEAPPKIKKSGRAPASGARNIHLAPATEPVSEALRALLDARTPVDIPAAGRDHFMNAYYPLLRQGMKLGSSDGSAALPQIQDPELVVTAVHVAPAPAARPARRSSRKAGAADAQRPTGPALELHWHWEYTLAGMASRRPMVSDGSGYRDERFETQLLQTVADVLAPFPGAVSEPFPHAPSMYPGSNEPVCLKDVVAARFTNEALPALAALEQVRVETKGEAPDYTELTGTPQIGISTHGTDDGDWFDLAVTVTLDGTDIPFGELFLALASDGEHLMLPNGHYFALDQPEFAQLRKLIEEARSLQEPNESLKISRYQAGLWEELKELATSAEQAEAWHKSVTGLLDLHEVSPVPVPESLQASLRPYQQEGFNWLVFLLENRLGGVLADDMGLGKTLQTLALISHAKSAAGSGEAGSGEAGSGDAAPQPATPDSAAVPGKASLPFLVVAPTSVVPNWAAESRRFAPNLSTTAVTDTFRKSGGDAATLVAGADVVVTSYTLFRLDYDAYASQEWAGLILDEAQFVKNHLTKASQLARTFPAPFKLAITGTPMENNLMELWALFAVTAPGLFPSSSKFTDYYRTPVEKDGDAGKLKQLRRKIRPLIMRRTKDAVAKELPPKQEQVLELELAPRHRTIYQRHLQRERQKVLGLLGDMDRNRFAIFKSLTTLRMLSLDASLVDPKYASAPSSKLDVLFEQLEDVVAEGHRALIFSQFTSFLGKARERLDAAGIEYVYLDGKTRKRGEVIDKFKSGTAPVFLISLKSGGFGLNLTEADYCFLLDPWWNPATENQAVDRTHRIGQTKNVMVYRLVAKDTIEEKVMALKEKKAKLFTSVMDDDAMFSAAITADDVRGLFDA
jgi:superfamily II DNA or RNA helicase